MGAPLKILTVEEIQAETVQWLWQPFIALGNFSYAGFVKYILP